MGERARLVRLEQARREARPTGRRLRCYSRRVQIDEPAAVEAPAQRAHANFRLALRIALGFVALLWVLQFANWSLDVDPGLLGVRPRTLAGLPGILFAPLSHADFAHLIANSPPLFVLGMVMMTLYPQSTSRVLPAVYFGAGVAVWLFGREASHLGASGLVYGLAVYIFTAGVIRRDRRAIAAALLVSFMYGALVWGLLPIRSRMSWETHLAAAVIGLAMALVLRRLDAAPQTRYSWEDEHDDDLSGRTSSPVSGQRSLDDERGFRDIRGP